MWIFRRHHKFSPDWLSWNILLCSPVFFLFSTTLYIRFLDLFFTLLTYFIFIFHLCITYISIYIYILCLLALWYWEKYYQTRLSSILGSLWLVWVHLLLLLLLLKSTDSYALIFSITHYTYTFYICIYIFLWITLTITLRFIEKHSIASRF